jgi:aryl-alcohol dehydrogenase
MAGYLTTGKLALNRSARRFFTATATSTLRLIEAAVARSPSAPFTVEKINLRSIKSNEMLVRIVASGLCHTDVAVKEKNLCSFPIILGHEGSGVIESVGSAINSADYNVGDSVLLSYAACGSCPHCVQAKPFYCYNHGHINFSGLNWNTNNGFVHSFPANSSHNPRSNPNNANNEVNHGGESAAATNPLYGSFFQQSSFATHAIVTAQNTVKVSPLHDLSVLAPLGCGIQTGAGAVINSLKVKIGETVAIFGCGAVGLSAIMAAKLSHAKAIIAVDLNEKRLRLAKELGATHTILISGAEQSEEISRNIKEIVAGGVNYSIDTSGNPTALRSAFLALQSAGTAALIGGSGASVDINMAELLHGRNVRGIIQGDSVSKVFLPQLIDLWEKKLFPFEKLITFYEGLSSLNKAVADCKSAEAAVIKPVIKISKK